MNLSGLVRRIALALRDLPARSLHPVRRAFALHFLGTKDLIGLSGKRAGMIGVPGNPAAAIGVRQLPHAGWKGWIAIRSLSS